MAPELVKSAVAEGATNTARPLTTRLSWQGVAFMKPTYFIPPRVAERAYSRHTPGPDGCLISTYSVASHGYAQVGWTSESVRTMTTAHRAAWVHVNGQIPEGMTIDHLCKNRRCVNVDHLRMLTNFENARRTSGRDWPLGQCVNGHPNSELVRGGDGKLKCGLCSIEWQQRYAANNPEKVRERQADYVARNPEKVRESRKRYAAANQEKLRADRARWRANNPEKVREYKARYRAKCLDRRAAERAANNSELIAETPEADQ